MVLKADVVVWGGCGCRCSRAGRARTDSTHVLSAAREVCWLERVAETLRSALNALAQAAPDWLVEVAEPDWFKHYATRAEGSRFPKARTQRDEVGLRIGRDGTRLLEPQSQAPADAGGGALLADRAGAAVPAIEPDPDQWGALGRAVEIPARGGLPVGAGDLLACPVDGEVVGGEPTACGCLVADDAGDRSGEGEAVLAAGADQHVRVDVSGPATPAHRRRHQPRPPRRPPH